MATNPCLNPWTRGRRTGTVFPRASRVPAMPWTCWREAVGPGLVADKLAEIFGPYLLVTRLMGRIVVVSRWNTETKRSQNGDNKKTMMSGGVWYQPLVISYIYWSVEGHMISYSPHGQDIRLMDSCKYCIRRQKLQHRAAEKLF